MFLIIPICLLVVLLLVVVLILLSVFPLFILCFIPVWLFYFNRLLCFPFFLPHLFLPCLFSSLYSCYVFVFVVMFNYRQRLSKGYINPLKETLYKRPELPQNTVKALEIFIGILVKPCNIP